METSKGMRVNEPRGNIIWGRCVAERGKSSLGRQSINQFLGKAVSLVSSVVMIHQLKVSCVVMTIALATTFWSKDEEDLPDHELSEWKIGEIISGGEVDLEKLEVKVVAIENWGLH